MSKIRTMVSILLFCWVVVACQGNQRVTIPVESQPMLMDILTLEERVKILESNLPKLTTCTSCHQIYFDAFPNDFETLDAIFGYNQSTAIAGLLYDNGDDYINAFFGQLNLEKSLIYKKSIRIALLGRWDADAITTFQVNLVPFILSENKIIYDQDLVKLIDVLKNESDQDVEYFWYFYFDGEHPYKIVPNALDEFVKNQDTRVYELMHLGHTRSVNGVHDH